MTRALLALALILMPVAAATQSCGDYALTIESFTSRHSVELVGRWVSSDFRGNYLIEIWANASNGFFVVINVYPNGTVCVQDAGSDWVPVQQRNTEPKGSNG